MTREHERGTEGSVARGTKAEVVGTPGKRTLTEKLPAAATPMQAKQERAAGDSASSAHGVAGGAGIAALGAGGAADAGSAATGAMITPTSAWTLSADPGISGGNECHPEGLSRGWSVVDHGATWGVNLTSLTTHGTMHVMQWASHPTTMVTPNTVNPVDNGNVNNIRGHNNYWKFAVDAMRNYSKTGASHHWHAYVASLAHETAHCNTDWMVTCLGALWPAANADINALSISKASAPNATAAKPLLEAMIDARLATLQAALDAKWNAIPDTPGSAASAGTGYAAGQAVLDKLIAAVEAYAASKGWSSASKAETDH